MSNFSSFKSAVAEVMGERHPGAEVTIREVVKTNGTYTGITVVSAGQKIAPTVYLEDFFKMYEDGTSFDDVISKIENIFEEHSEGITFDPESFTDYEATKGSIRARVVSLTQNKAMQEERPSRVIADDLLVTYYSVIEGLDGASVPITNDVAEGWGVDESTLYDQAVSNMESETVFMNMACVLAEITGQEEPDESEYAPMWVLTNKNKLNGAGQLALNGVLDNIRAEIGDFYVIPSSIHECIIVPAVGDPDVFNGMIAEVNETSVEDNEVLGTHIYKYDGELSSDVVSSEAA